MTVETATNPNDYNTSYPADADPRSEGAAHLRLIKTVQKADRGMILTSKSAAYGFVLTDANNGFLHPAADTTARTWTIPANSSVAFPVGTCLAFFNEVGAGALTIAITTDTLRLAQGSAGSRTLATNGIAVAIKITTTSWMIAGEGLS